MIAVASSWTSNADASCWLINKDDRRYSLWQWFDKDLAVCFSNLCRVLLSWRFWKIVKLSHLSHKWRFIYVYWSELQQSALSFLIIDDQSSVTLSFEWQYHLLF